MTTTKTIKVVMREGYNDWYLLKTGSKEQIVNAGNSERFASAIENTILLIDGSKRVYATFNKHIESKLQEQRVDGWRVDGVPSEGLETRVITGVSYWNNREYEINIDEATARPMLNNNEQVCKTCGRIVNKTEIVGAYCTECLFGGNESQCLAYRFGYHSFGGEYKIYEDVDTTTTPVFGVEIERDYLSRGYSSSFSKDLKEATLGACKTLYKGLKKQVKRRHVFMCDGSLCNDGIEWITYPQTLKAYKKQSKEIAETLEVMAKHNFGASSRAGNHIHINRSYFDGNSGTYDGSRFASAKMALMLAENWEAFCKICGRDIRACDYSTKPRHAKSDSVFTLATKTIENECNHCVAVNLQHSKTIELRLFGAIENVEDLLLYLDVAQSLAIFAKKKSLEFVQRATLADVFKYLTDKEHITMIIERLGDDHQDDVEKLQELLKGDDK